MLQPNARAKSHDRPRHTRFATYSLSDIYAKIQIFGAHTRRVPRRLPRAAWLRYAWPFGRGFAAHYARLRCALQLHYFAAFDAATLRIFCLPKIHTLRQGRYIYSIVSSCYYLPKYLPTCAVIQLKLQRPDYLI